MKKVVCVFCILVLLMSSGCKDITGSHKPGSFGKTLREQAMVSAVTEKYGDLTQKGDPRFLEARMTSAVDDFIPIDTVSKYSEGSEKLYAWFVYDNFNKDEIEVEWVYVDDDYSIHTFKEISGDDFGRGAFILEKPDDGWALGNYKVIIRGHGVQVVLTFGIHEGATVSTPLVYAEGKFALSPTPGWYFTGWVFHMSAVDVSIVGGRRGTLTGTTDVIWDYSEGTGDKNNFSTKVWRTWDDGKAIASGMAVTTWEDPPTYIGGDEKATLKVSRSVESEWGVGKFTASFDSATLKPGGATEAQIQFVKPDGNNLVGAFDGTLQMQKASKGTPGAKKAIILHFAGYGFTYYYEWKE